MFYKDDRLALFIDGLSLKNAARCNDMQVDYKKLRGEFSRRGRMIRCFFYTPFSETGEQDNARPLIDFLDYNGFTLKTRAVRDREDGGFRKAINFLHIQMATDAIAMKDKIDHAVIMSGDAGMIPVVQELKRSGLRVSICSTRHGNEGGMISDELRREADSFIDIGEMREMVAIQRDAA